MNKWLAGILLLTVFSVLAQNAQRPIPDRERLRQRNQQQFEQLQRKWIEEMEQAARLEGRTAGGLAPPSLIPEGWVHDYGYNSDLFKYLRWKYEGAEKSNKDLYLYLYADWNDDCKVFRKAVGRKDYQALFEGNEILMVNYTFLRTVYGAQFHNLPVLLKVHPDGSVGPESVHPVSTKHDHPRKAYYKLKKFLESQDG